MKQLHIIFGPNNADNATALKSVVGEIWLSSLKREAKSRDYTPEITVVIEDEVSDAIRRSMAPIQVVVYDSDRQQDMLSKVEHINLNGERKVVLIASDKLDILFCHVGNIKLAGIYIISSTKMLRYNPELVS